MRLFCRIGLHNWKDSKCSKCGEERLYNSNYESIIIGDQVWMSTNLNVNRFRNGDRIFETHSDEEWKKAGREGLPLCKESGKKYGMEYNWYAVNDNRGLAPEGWKIPTKEDFGPLVLAVDHNTNALKAKGQGRGTGVGTNTSGFSAQLLNGHYASFWTSSDRWTNTAYSIYIPGDESVLYQVTNEKNVACAVRCIKMDDIKPNKTQRVEVGLCEKCNRAIRVKRLRMGEHLTCKCGHVNVVGRKEWKASNGESVIFKQKYTKTFLKGTTNTYEEWTAPNAKAAKEFLDNHSVTEQQYYLAVETPEGNWCKDRQGIYQD